MFVTTFYEKSCILNKILLEGTYDKDNIYILFEKYTLDVFSGTTMKNMYLIIFTTVVINNFRRHPRNQIHIT